MLADAFMRGDNLALATANATGGITCIGKTS